MTTYQLTQHDLPPKKVEAACIHRDDDFVRFHDADHGLVYAVQRGLLLAIETVETDGQAEDVEQDCLPDGVFEAWLKRGITTPNRWLLARQFGWSIEQVNEIPDWLAVWLHNAD